MKTCSIEDCDKKHYAKGWCKKHYKRWHKYGDPLFVKQHRREHGTTVDLAYIKSQCVIDGETGCWLWQRARDTHGYGLIGIDGKTPRVHRVAWELKNGPIPEGEEILHKCPVIPRNKNCCNPDHLKAGPHSENMNDDDMIEYRRSSLNRRMNRRKTMKLADHECLSIVDQYNAGVTQTALAERHGVSQTIISKLINRKTYKHLEFHVSDAPRPNMGGRNRLSDAEVDGMRRLHRCGRTYREIADAIGISMASVSKYTADLPARPMGRPRKG